MIVEERYFQLPLPVPDMPGTGTQQHYHFGISKKVQAFLIKPEAKSWLLIVKVLN